MSILTEQSILKQKTVRSFVTYHITYVLQRVNNRQFVAMVTSNCKKTMTYLTLIKFSFT
jgi:hypothetical protein